MTKITRAQTEALAKIAQGPMLRGTFLSGWGPSNSGYSAWRLAVREATANKLLSLGLIERRDVEDDPRASTIRITPAGLAALNAATAPPGRGDQHG